MDCIPADWRARQAKWVSLLLLPVAFPILSAEEVWYFLFLQRAKFLFCLTPLCCCWNHLWMEAHVLTLGEAVIPVLQPRLPHTEAHFLFMWRLSSRTCCQDVAGMTHQFPSHILWHHSNLPGLSPVISHWFQGCNLEHEWDRFHACLFFRAADKNYLVSTFWKHYAEYQVC